MSRIASTVSRATSRPRRPMRSQIVSIGAPSYNETAHIVFTLTLHISELSWYGTARARSETIAR